MRIDTLAHRSRWRHRHPGEKALLCFGLLGLSVALPTWPGALLVGVTALALALGPARVPGRELLRAARAPLAFVAIGVLPVLVAGRGVAVDAEQARAALVVAGRSAAALTCLLLFAVTTPMGDVLPRLVRLGVPPAVVEVASLVYSMLSTLLTTAASVRAAQAGRLGFRSWRTSLRSTGMQATTVFVRAFDRARRLDEGLALRGYTGSLAVLVEPRPVSLPAVAATLALLAGVTAVTLAL